MLIVNNMDGESKIIQKAPEIQKQSEVFVVGPNEVGGYMNMFEQVSREGGSTKQLEISDPRVQQFGIKDTGILGGQTMVYEVTANPLAMEAMKIYHGLKMENDQEVIRASFDKIIQKLNESTRLRSQTAQKGQI